MPFVTIADPHKPLGRWDPNLNPDPGFYLNADPDSGFWAPDLHLE